MSLRLSSLSLSLAVFLYFTCWHFWLLSLLCSLLWNQLLHVKAFINSILNGFVLCCSIDAGVRTLMMVLFLMICGKKLWCLTVLSTPNPHLLLFASKMRHKLADSAPRVPSVRKTGDWSFHYDPHLSSFIFSHFGQSHPPVCIKWRCDHLGTAPSKLSYPSFLIPPSCHLYKNLYEMRGGIKPCRNKDTFLFSA